MQVLEFLVCACMFVCMSVHVHAHYFQPLNMYMSINSLTMIFLTISSIAGGVAMQMELLCHSDNKQRERKRCNFYLKYIELYFSVWYVVSTINNYYIVQCIHYHVCVCVSLQGGLRKYRRIDRAADAHDIWEPSIWHCWWTHPTTNVTKQPCSCQCW